MGTDEIERQLEYLVDCIDRNRNEELEMRRFILDKINPLHDLQLKVDELSRVCRDLKWACAVLFVIVVWLWNR